MEGFPSQIPGAQRLYEWFGYWPDFHEAEVVSLLLQRSEPSELCVHTWHMSNRVDANGSYVLERHVLVRFLLGGIESLNLDGFNRQNVLGELVLSAEGEGFRIELSPCYGMAGSIVARDISIAIEPAEMPLSMEGSVASSEVE